MLSDQLGNELVLVFECEPRGILLLSELEDIAVVAAIAQTIRFPIRTFCLCGCPNTLLLTVAALAVAVTAAAASVLCAVGRAGLLGSLGDARGFLRSGGWLLRALLPLLSWCSSSTRKFRGGVRLLRSGGWWLRALLPLV